MTAKLWRYRLKCSSLGATMENVLSPLDSDWDCRRERTNWSEHFRSYIGIGSERDQRYKHVPIHAVFKIQYKIPKIKSIFHWSRLGTGEEICDEQQARQGWLTDLQKESYISKTVSWSLKDRSVFIFAIDLTWKILEFCEILYLCMLRDICPQTTKGNRGA